MDINKLKPCGDKLLVKPLPVSDRTPGGIFKPEIRFLDLVWAKVLAISDGFWGNNGDWIQIDKQFQIGDTIMYQKGQLVSGEDFPDYGLIQMAAIIAREKREGEE